MGMVVLRATSRLRFLPTPHETLDRHFNRLFPKDCQPWKRQAVEAFLVAHRNLYIAHEQRNKHRQEMASAALIFLRVNPHNLYLGMLAKTAELDDFIPSPRVWPDQETFQYLPQVRKVLGAMPAADPRERIKMRTVGLCLEHHGLWARTTTGLQATASAGAPEMAAASTAAATSPSPGFDGRGNIATSLNVKTLPACIHRLLSVVDYAADHGVFFTADGQVEPGGGGRAPSWLEVENAKENDAWWKNVPIPEALARKGPQPRFAV
ncbi:unnamed protein product, partial [Ectocarpus sp. 12 AP-2014]